MEFAVAAAVVVTLEKKLGGVDSIVDEPNKEGLVVAVVVLPKSELVLVLNVKVGRTVEKEAEQVVVSVGFTIGVMVRPDSVIAGVAVTAGSDFTPAVIIPAGEKIGAAVAGFVAAGLVVAPPKIFPESENVGNAGLASVTTGASIQEDDAVVIGDNVVLATPEETFEFT